MKSLQQYILLAGIAFVLHIIWETSHVGLYTGYEHLAMAKNITFFATLGDALYTICVALCLALIKRNINWMRAIQTIDYLSIALCGFILALLIEYKALALGRWEYTENMPIVPILEVGMSPLLQMTLLLPLSIFLASYIQKILTENRP